MSEAQLLPVIWTLASMVIFVLVALAVPPARAAQLRITAGGRMVEPAARLIYYIGLPYAALLTNSLALIDLGLAGNSGGVLGWSGTDWLNALGSWLVVGFMALAPIGLAARQLARQGRLLGVDVRPAGAIIVDSVYSEVHWAFYRAAPLILLNDAYLAALIGVGLVAVEQAVTLAHSGLGREAEDRQSWLGQLLLLAMSSTLFVLTRNTWLIIALHVIVELALKVWTSRWVYRPIAPPLEVAPAEPADQPLAEAD